MYSVLLNTYSKVLNTYSKVLNKNFYGAKKKFLGLRKNYLRSSEKLSNPCGRGTPFAASLMRTQVKKSPAKGRKGQKSKVLFCLSLRLK